MASHRNPATKVVSAKRSGGTTSPLEAHADFLLAVIKEQPDLTSG
jgi:hypothetical protein